MELVKRKRRSIVAQCENCRSQIEVPLDNTINPRASSIDLKSVMQCKCGEYHNLIIDTKKHNVISSPPRTYQEEDDDALTCPSCGSEQLHSGDQGFGLGKAVVGHIVIGPLGLLGGFLGHKKTRITCLKCGYKWQAGKR